MRLDEYIFKNNLAKSRSKAKEMIINGYISVNDIISRKPSYDVKLSDKIKIIDNPYQEFVSRGGLKLKKALELFNIDLTNKVVLDIGSSTGGFTDCMLQNGAEKVFAVDVGNNQLADKLRMDNRVISMENTDIREANIPLADFIGCDVSFISLTKIFESVYNILKDTGSGVFLIKPQFEAGRENISKNGIVKNPKVHKRVISNIISNALTNRLYVKELTYSPIQGGDGNIEYLIHISKNGDVGVNQHTIDQVVDTAFKLFKK